MKIQSQSETNCLFAFTVDVEPDIPHRVSSYIGLEHINDLLELLREMNISGTFLVTGGIALSHPGIIQNIKANGHEVGCHGLDHEPLNNLNPEGLVFPKLSREKKKEIIGLATQAISAAVLDPPTSFRSPFLSFDLETIVMLTELGYSVDSSLWAKVETKQIGPYFPLQNIQKSILEVPVHSGSVSLAQPYSQMEPGISGFSLRLVGQDAVRQATRSIMSAGNHERKKKLILFTCHPWEYIPQPPWRTTLPEHFWRHTDQLLHETRSFLEFVKQDINPSFVTLRQVYDLW